MTLNYTCNNHNNGHANGADEQDFQSATDSCQIHCTLRTLHTKKKNVNKKYYNRNNDEANVRDFHDASDVCEGVLIFARTEQEPFPIAGPIFVTTTTHLSPLIRNPQENITTKK